MNYLQVVQHFRRIPGGQSSAGGDRLGELVAYRNDLVHHFIDRFDVWTLDRFRDAVAYLDDAHFNVDLHYASLAAWAKSIQDTHAMTASFFASKTWEDFFVHGVFGRQPRSGGLCSIVVRSQCRRPRFCAWWWT